MAKRWPWSASQGSHSRTLKGDPFAGADVTAPPPDVDDDDQDEAAAGAAAARPWPIEPNPHRVELARRFISEFPGRYPGFVPDLPPDIAALIQLARDGYEACLDLDAALRGYEQGDPTGGMQWKE